MEKVRDIKALINDTMHGKEVRYTRQLRDAALCYILGIMYAFREFKGGYREFIIYHTWDDKKAQDKLSCESMAELADALSECFMRIGIEGAVEARECIAHAQGEEKRLGEWIEVLSDTYDKLKAMPEEKL